ncbi:ABC transporter ATP-binding protein [Ramlibacter sp. PS4R-6]|uniref:ABC transporter ATP-binding protein n=1 Tax=Ramlibacter sp. PS4R-6 TaxID=3133438 RepID=UPI0030B39520
MTQAVAPMLSVRGLGKCFRRYPSRWAQLREIVTGRATHEPHWVLRELSFDIAGGEAVGLVGRNGAGKSTLLKLLTGVQVPTTGAIERRGSIAAILELGVGFHPDFTGRENARQQLLLQGVREDRVPALLPQVEAFAEVGEYFDEPVHTYSSGMQMRVAFSAATAMQPDVLIVDEALAVGDAYFQHKCYERLRGMREAGAAIVLVSHDPAPVRNLCSRALLLEDGRVVEDGAPSSVLETYNMLLAPQMSRQYAALPADAQGQGRRGGTGEAHIESVQWRQEGQPRQVLVSEVPAELALRVRVAQPLQDLTVGILVRDRLGNDLFGTNTHHQGVELPREPGVYDVVWQMPGFHLGPGYYSLTVAAHAGAQHPAGSYDWWDRCLTFQVLPRGGPVAIGPCSFDVSVSWGTA